MSQANRERKKSKREPIAASQVQHVEPQLDVVERATPGSQGMEGPGSRSNLNRWEHGRGEWSVEIGYLRGRRVQGQKMWEGPARTVPLRAWARQCTARVRQDPGTACKPNAFFSSPTLITPRDFRTVSQQSFFNQLSRAFEDMDPRPRPPGFTLYPRGLGPGCTTRITSTLN